MSSHRDRLSTVPTSARATHGLLDRSHPTAAATVQMSAAEVNDAVVYSGWTVFNRFCGHGDVDTDYVARLEGAMTQPVAVRAWYDVSVFRADAELMVWWTADSPADLQAAQRDILSADGDAALVPVWSGIGLHRPAEFNRAHVPAFMTGSPPRDYVCVYPFVRSYEWYLLPADERAALLREHGQAAAGYADVLANTVAAFGLGDYEWLLAFEADQPHRIVDLLRDLRATGARRHVREEIPFYTGRRIGA